jgi:hypothetical protein
MILTNIESQTRFCLKASKSVEEDISGLALIDRSKAMFYLPKKLWLDIIGALAGEKKLEP